MKYRTLLFTALMLCAMKSSASQDEMSLLVEKVHAPARFASHVPDFSASEEDFTFKGADAPKVEKFWTIKDGGRYVATLHKGMCQLDMITFNPEKTVEKPPFKDYYGWGSLLGTRITTALWWDSMGPGGDTRKIEFSGGGKTLTLTVTETWSRNRNAESKYLMTLRCDPVQGYVWDVTTSLRTDRVPATRDGKPINPEVFNWQVGVTGWTQRNNQRWPATWTHERTVFLRNDGKLVGFYLNPDAIDRSKFKRTPVKNGGYVAKLPDKEGWGVALVHVEKGGLECNNNTCNMWADSHNMIRLPEKPDADGMYRATAKWRFGAVPPEAVNAILSNTEMDMLGHDVAAK